jgi:uncharacterized lipoprotein
MKKLVLITLALTLAACSQDTKNLEKKLDDQAKDIREIKAMIQKGGGAGVRAPQPGREEAAPDAVFAVDVAQNLKMGMVEGPNAALVTIVEAWDFA